MKSSTQWGFLINAPIVIMAPPNLRNGPHLWGISKKTAEHRADTALIALDEFALQSTTCTHYAWAGKNTTPALPSNEKKREKLNGFLAVDLDTGQTTVDFQPQAKTENAVYVLTLIVLRYVQRGFRHVVFLLDNCSIHNDTMKAALALLLAVVPWLKGSASTSCIPPCTRQSSIRRNT